jgi:nucleotide-binding universal stress UspA family protein
MRRILVPIDPAQPARTRSAIDEIVRICRNEQVEVSLLRVQPRVNQHVAMFFDTDELRQLHETWGQEELDLARSLLDAARVPHTSTVLVGRSAETIVAFAREQGCDRIVFGAVQPGLAGRVFGSLAQQVRAMLGTRGDLQVLGS